MHLRIFNPMLSYCRRPSAGGQLECGEARGHAAGSTNGAGIHIQAHSTGPARTFASNARARTSCTRVAVGSCVRMCACALTCGTSVQYSLMHDCGCVRAHALMCACAFVRMCIRAGVQYSRATTFTVEKETGASTVRRIAWGLGF